MCDVTMVVQYLYGCVVREITVRMLGRGLSLVYADDRVEDKSILVVDLEEKLCQLVEEFE